MPIPNWQAKNEWYIGTEPDIQYSIRIPYAPIDYDSETTLKYTIYPVLDGDDRYFISRFDDKIKTMYWRYILPEMKNVFDILNNTITGVAANSTREFYLWTGRFGKIRKIFIKDLTYKPTTPSFHYKNIRQYTRFHETIFSNHPIDSDYYVCGDIKIGQGFVASDFDKIDQIGVLVKPYWDYMSGLSHPEDDLTLNLYLADTNFNPTGSPLVTKVYDKDSITTQSMFWTYILFFPTPLSLKIGSKYVLTMSSPGCRVEKSYYAVQISYFSQYVDGKLMASPNGGFTWFAHPSDAYSCVFYIKYGYDEWQLNKRLIYEGQIDFIFLEDVV